jgi:hypothetical protein
MYSGLLSGKMTRERIARLPLDDWRKRNRNFQEPLLSLNLELVEVLREIVAPWSNSGRGGHRMDFAQSVGYRSDRGCKKPGASLRNHRGWGISAERQ